jgi:hypothetical protein
VPAQNYHQRHQTCCDQHYSYNSRSISIYESE